MFSLCFSGSYCMFKDPKSGKMLLMKNYQEMDKKIMYSVLPIIPFFEDPNNLTGEVNQIVPYVVVAITIAFIVHILKFAIEEDNHGDGLDLDVLEPVVLLQFITESSKKFIDTYKNIDMLDVLAILNFWKDHGVVGLMANVEFMAPDQYTKYQTRFDGIAQVLLKENNEHVMKLLNFFERMDPALLLGNNLHYLDFLMPNEPLQNTIDTTMSAGGGGGGGSVWFLLALFIMLLLISFSAWYWYNMYWISATMKRFHLNNHHDDTYIK